MDKEGKAAATKKRWAEASDCWLDCLYVGQGLGRGSDLSFTLTGIDRTKDRPDAGAGTGLARIRLALSAPAILSAKDPLRVATYASPTVEATADAICRRDAALRMLITEFAIRLYRDRHDRLPEDLSELVPDFLPAVFVDPFRGRSLIYRRSGGRFVVYSTGPNGTDNGGALGDVATMYLGDVDFDLDTLVCPATSSGSGMVTVHGPVKELKIDLDMRVRFRSQCSYEQANDPYRTTARSRTGSRLYRSIGRTIRKADR